jgi:hypothetical protein
LSVEQRRAALASKISIENLRVDISAPIIFVCGGLTDVKEIEPPSIRDALLRRLVRDRALKVVFAEDYKDWINDSIYNDLMTFEDDIAQISSLIVLILESPGSLTELGLFSSSIDFISKLLVLVSTEHYDEDSFIKLGPIRYLESMSNSCVYAYPWDPRQPSRTITPYISDIETDISNFLSKANKTEKFSADNNGHIAFLVYEIISFLRAAKFKEIHDFLGSIGIFFKQEKTKRIIFLLKKISLIEQIKRGNIEYFLPLEDQHKIIFQGSIDRTAEKIEITNQYKNTLSEKTRVTLIEEKMGRNR